MKCHICGKENASIHIREIRDGEKKSYYICKECAAKQSGAGDIMGLAQMIYKLTSGLSGIREKNKKDRTPAGKKDPFPMDMGIGGIIELFQDKDHPLFPAPEDQKKENPEKLLRCPFCGWGTEQLKKTGHLGCPECYQVFAEILKEKRSGKNRKTAVHTGKHPGNLAPELLQEIGEEQKKRLLLREKEEQLARMKSDIQSAVAHEDYEKAALLRDQIWELETEMNDILYPVRKEETEKAGKTSGSRRTKGPCRKVSGPVDICCRRIQRLHCGRRFQPAD